MVTFVSFIDLAKSLLNITETENGDKAYVSTLSPCLDYFALVGGKRDKLKECYYLFCHAFAEDKVTAIKLLFYTRDIRQGLGEKDIFRFLFYMLAKNEPEIAIKMIPYIPSYGRYDDLLFALETPVQDEVISFIGNKLKEDINNKINHRPISLLAKWLPSINTSNAKSRYYARIIAKGLNLSYKQYRKDLAYLRGYYIIENYLREKRYDFEYSKIPSVALNKYRLAFRKNDKERFEKYLEEVKTGKTKMNVDTLDVVTFISQVRGNYQIVVSDELDYYQTAWEKIVGDNKIDSHMIVVRDGSGSMYMHDRSYRVHGPIDIADAMALLTAERLSGAFHDKFITFSSRPKLVDLSNYNNIYEKVSYIRFLDDCSNTDIQKVYELILDVYKMPDFKPEDALDKILIVSDMEFDYLNQEFKFETARPVNKSTFEYFKEEFSKLNYPMPELVYWNVESRGFKVPVTKNELGVKLVSGSNKNIIDMIMNNESLDPYDFMSKVLKKYSFVDELFK